MADSAYGAMARESIEEPRLAFEPARLPAGRPSPNVGNPHVLSGPLPSPPAAWAPPAGTAPEAAEVEACSADCGTIAFLALFDLAGLGVLAGGILMVVVGNIGGGIVLVLFWSLWGCMMSCSGLLTQGVPGVPQDPLPPPSGPRAPSPDSLKRTENPPGTP